MFFSKNYPQTGGFQLWDTGTLLSLLIFTLGLTVKSPPTFCYIIITSRNVTCLICLGDRGFLINLHLPLVLGRLANSIFTTFFFHFVLALSWTESSKVQPWWGLGRTSTSGGSCTKRSKELTDRHPKRTGDREWDNNIPIEMNYIGKSWFLLSRIVL